MYEGIITGLKRSSRMALMYELILIGRRILLLYMAMFVTKQALVHIILFILTNIIFISYLVGVKPFIEKAQYRL